MKAVFSCLHLLENATYPYYNYSVTPRFAYGRIIHVIAANTDLKIKHNTYIIVIFFLQVS